MVYTERVETAGDWEPLVAVLERPGPDTAQLVTSDAVQVMVEALPGRTRVGLAEMVAVGLSTLQFAYW